MPVSIFQFITLKESVHKVTVLLLLSNPVSVFKAFASLLIGIRGKVSIMQELAHSLLFLGSYLIWFWL